MVPADAFAAADIATEESGLAVLRIHFSSSISLAPVHFKYNSVTAAREAMRLLGTRLGGDKNVNLDRLENGGEAPKPATVVHQAR